MKRVISQPIVSCFEESGFGEEGEDFETLEMSGRGKQGQDIDHITDQLACTTLQKRHSTKQGEGELSSEKHGLWRPQQKRRAARLEKQLRAKWALEELIDEQLHHYHSHYNPAMVPSTLKDVARLLMPKGALTHEMAALSWFGDWRPSSILDLLRRLLHSSSAFSSSFPNSAGVKQALSQLIHEIRIEEAVLDEEMAEIQANCVLHLPFGPVNNRADAPALGCIQYEFKKIHRVITKTQNLRFKALEMAVKKVLSQTDAAEFLVAFVGIQDLIHQFAMQQKLRKGSVSVPIKA